MAELGRRAEAALHSAQAAAETCSPAEHPDGAKAAPDRAAGRQAEGAGAPDWACSPAAGAAGRARTSPVRWVRQLPAAAGSWPEQLFMPELSSGRGKSRTAREAPRRRGRPQAGGFSRRCGMARGLPHLPCMQAPTCLPCAWPTRLRCACDKV